MFLPSGLIIPSTYLITWYVFRLWLSNVLFYFILLSSGIYPVKPDLPAVGGFEGVGKITEIGSDVTHLKPGDIVLPAINALGKSWERQKYDLNMLHQNLTKVIMNKWFHFQKLNENIVSQYCKIHYCTRKYSINKVQFLWD